MFGKSGLNKYSKPIKIVVSLSLFTFLWIGFIDFSNNVDIYQFIASINKPIYLGGIVILLIPNLICEAQKWNSLVEFHMDRKLVMKSILVGYTSGTLSPNRLGEFVGRVSLFPTHQRASLTGSVFLGSMIQGIVTVMFGLTGIFLLPSELNLVEKFDLEYLVVFSLILLLCSILAFQFRKYLGKQINNVLQAMAEAKLPNIRRAFAWAVLRYLIFTLQFYFALLLFNYQGSVVFAISGVSIMYLIQSYIPLTSLGELGVREFLAVLIFGPWMESSFAAVFPALVIWIVNIVIPSLSGLIVIRNQRILKLAS